MSLVYPLLLTPILAHSHSSTHSLIEKHENDKLALGVDDVLTGFSWEIKSDELAFVKQVGEGASAKVWKGEFRTQEVAIKVLKEKVNADQLKDFQKEFALFGYDIFSLFLLSFCCSILFLFSFLFPILFSFSLSYSFSFLFFLFLFPILFFLFDFSLSYSFPLFSFSFLFIFRFLFLHSTTLTDKQQITEEPSYCVFLWSVYGSGLVYGDGVVRQWESQRRPQNAKEYRMGNGL